MALSVSGNNGFSLVNNVAAQFQSLRSDELSTDSLIFNTGVVTTLTGNPDLSLTGDTLDLNGTTAIDADTVTYTMNATTATITATTLNLTGTSIGFFGITAVTRPQITAAGVSAADILTALDSIGIVESV